MFPIDYDLEEIASNDKVATGSNPMTDDIGRSVAFDYEAGDFVLIDGALKEPTKIEAIKQWIELFIRTELNKYGIYTNTFGVDLTGLVSYRLPRGYQVSEIIRQINEGILNKCPNIDSVSEWSFDKGHFYFTVKTNTGEEVEIYG